MPGPTPKLPVLILVTLFLTTISTAQDSHYWTYHYGTRATLLGGAVIGSVLDLSGTYYNPGGLALVENPEVLMAAEAVHYTNYSLKNVNGQTNVVLDSPSLSTAPSLLAGSLNLRGQEAKNLFYYSFLTRHYTDLDIRGTLAGDGDTLPSPFQDRHLYARFTLAETLGESWAGFTWARKLGPMVGVGLTQYLTIRGHEGSIQSIAQLYHEHSPMAVTMFDRQYAYTTVGLLWKGGVIIDFRKWTLGLTVTTPNIHLYGSGEAGVNTSATGQDLDGDSIQDAVMIADYQESVAARFPHPFSVGLGVTYKLAAARFYFSLEWFARVGRFRVLDLENFIGQSSGEEEEFEVVHELGSVVNYAAGLEYRWKDNLVTYLSVTRDHSAKKEGALSNLTLTDSNIWHTMAGAIFSVKKFHFTIGIGYSWSRDTYIWDASRAGADGFDNAVGLVRSLEYFYSSIRLLFGISF